MRNLLMLLLATSALLYSSCSSMPTAAQFEEWKAGVDKTVATAAIIADKAKSGLDAVQAGQVALEAKIEKAYADLEAKGAPVDGTPSDLWAWAVKNPAESSSSLGALALVFGAMFAKYKRAKAAVMAQTDATAALPPETQAAVKAAAATSPHMTPGVAGFIAAVENR